MLACVNKHGIVNLLLIHTEDVIGVIAEACSPIQISWLSIAVLKSEIDEKLVK